MGNFFKDLERAKPWEEKTLNLLINSTSGYKYENVADDPQYYYKGDIKITSLSTGVVKYLDVKLDNRIADTNNVLCEELVICDSGKEYKGDMKKDYDYMAIVSPQKRQVYVLDCAIMKKNYKRGRYIQINHPTQFTIGYLNKLDTIKEWGALLFTLCF